mmetsp:Transcript_11909/g.50035  ORF Transcript_11909/g.50035 Transcript_11909/m.50035 type:complete len:337 (-) Transcript_11909:50-1060(-)
MGTALEAGEDAEVDLVLQVVRDRRALLVDALLALAVEDHRAPRAAKGLVRGGGHHVGILEGRRDHVRGDEAGDVRHVGHEVGAHLVADLPHALVVVVARVRGRAGDDQLGAVQHGVGLEGVVVDEAGVLVEPVRQGLEENGGGGDLLLGGVEPVREVAAVGQVEAHDPVVGVQEAGVHLEVGGRSGEGLDVDPPLLGIQTERLQRALLAQRLGLIDELVPAVVPRARVSLGVLVGHHATHGFHDGAAGEVLGRDELQPFPLARLLALDDVGHLRVHLREGFVARLGPRDPGGEGLVRVRVGRYRHAADGAGASGVAEDAGATAYDGGEHRRRLSMR